MTSQPLIAKIRIADQPSYEKRFAHMHALDAYIRTLTSVSRKKVHFSIAAPKTAAQRTGA